MGRNSEDFELNAEQMSRLLNLSADPEQAEENGDVEEKKADLLCEILTNALEVDKTVTDSLPDVLRRFCQKLRSVAGERLIDLLLSPQTELSDIRRIKAYAKQLGVSVKTQAEYDVTLAIYHAAIASALVFHNEKISRYSYTELEESFDSLCEQRWVFEVLADLFSRAGKLCKEKKQT